MVKLCVVNEKYVIGNAGKNEDTQVLTNQTESIFVVEIELVVGEQVLHSVQLIDLLLAAFHQLRRIKKNYYLIIELLEKHIL